MWADPNGLEVARAAPKRALRVPFAVWMSLAHAHAHAETAIDDDAQTLLGAVGSNDLA
jgi:hypothetical protein